VSENHQCLSNDLANYDDLNNRSSGMTVSYNDNNLLEKQMENDSSKLVKERLMNNRYKNSNENLTHFVLSTEDRVRVKQYDSKDNFLPVYDDRIEEDRDEDNYTSNLDSPGNKKRRRKPVHILPGNILDKIISYFGHRTAVHLLCKGVNQKLVSYNEELKITEINMLGLKLKSFRNELEFLRERERFCISLTLREEFESDDCRQDWLNLSEAVRSQDLSPKDKIVLNLYFT
jgi:hypothetical protein